MPVNEIPPGRSPYAVLRALITLAREGEIPKGVSTSLTYEFPPGSTNATYTLSLSIVEADEIYTVRWGINPRMPTFMVIINRLNRDCFTCWETLENPDDLEESMLQMIENVELQMVERH